jgi:hypothetical protein
MIAVAGLNNSAPFWVSNSGDGYPGKEEINAAQPSSMAIANPKGILMPYQAMVRFDARFKARSDSALPVGLVEPNGAEACCKEVHSEHLTSLLLNVRELHP